MKPFTLLVKPVGGACNLGCRYCFYNSHPGGRIDTGLLERAIDSYCALPFDDSLKYIALQGGEPLLAPARVLDIIASKPVQRAIQTNATLVTPELAARFKEEGWLAGVSLDGPRDIHDAMRSGSFDAAVRGIRNLEDAGADYNLMCVVSQANVRRGKEVYRFLRDNFNTRFQQYIECTGPVASLAVSGEEWGSFLVDVFDEWIERDMREISVRLFDSVVSQILRGWPTQCSFMKECREHLVLEYDGSVYPCDFFVEKELCLGNIAGKGWAEMVSGDVYGRFACRKSFNSMCADCEWVDFCNGDCPRNRYSLCRGWKRFFARAVPELAARLLTI